MKTTAWTGGCRPKPMLQIGRGERQLVRHIFHSECRVWLAYWGAPLDMGVARTFWTNARYTAHATLRGA